MTDLSLRMKATVEDQPMAEVRSRILQDLPPYRPVARKLMMLTSNEDVHLKKVHEVLRTDAVFTGEVLRLANSPLMGSRIPVQSVFQAVMQLGLAKIQSLATTLALKAFLDNCSQPDEIETCWRHDLAGAIVCEKLAIHYAIDADVCYTTGLLHDIGRLALVRTWPDRYAQVFSNGHDGDADLLQREREIFGVDHCQAGQWILEHWEFPAEFGDAALLHHTIPDPKASNLLRIVYAAAQIADILDFRAFPDPPIDEVCKIAPFLPDTARKEICEQFGSFQEDVALQINTIECLLI